MAQESNRFHSGIRYSIRDTTNFHRKEDRRQSGYRRNTLFAFSKAHIRRSSHSVTSTSLTVRRWPTKSIRYSARNPPPSWTPKIVERYVQALKDIDEITLKWVIQEPELACDTTDHRRRNEFPTEMDEVPNEVVNDQGEPLGAGAMAYYVDPQTSNRTVPNTVQSFGIIVRPHRKNQSAMNKEKSNVEVPLISEVQKTNELMVENLSTEPTQSTSLPEYNLLARLITLNNVHADSHTDLSEVNAQNNINPTLRVNTADDTVPTPPMLRLFTYIPHELEIHTMNLNIDYATIACSVYHTYLSCRNSILRRKNLSSSVNRLTCSIYSAGN